MLISNETIRARVVNFDTAALLTFYQLILCANVDVLLLVIMLKYKDAPSH